MLENVKGKKRILMFCVNFFSYGQSIAEELSRQGCQVDLYDERPSNSFICKSMLRYYIAAYRPWVIKYYKSIIEKNKDRKYDFIFVVKNEAIDADVMQLLHQAYPDAKTILYLWDSVSNVPNGENRIKLYDRVLTFDPVDAKQYHLILRPLFYSSVYEKDHTLPITHQYDVTFIGTAHTIRPRVAKAVEQLCRQTGRHCFLYLYLPHKLVYFYNKLINSNYREIKSKDMHFQPLSAEKVESIYRESKSILDVEHECQRGLTMRTIETIGMEKKMITTNQWIKEYDFYNPKNILLIDRNHPNIDFSFLDDEYEPLPEKIKQRYTLKEFVREIFEFGVDS